MKEKTKKWLKAAGVRALKTAAQAALAVVGTSTVFIHEIKLAACSLRLGSGGGAQLDYKPCGLARG